MDAQQFGALLVVLGGVGPAFSTWVGKRVGDQPTSTEFWLHTIPSCIFLLLLLLLLLLLVQSTTINYLSISHRNRFLRLLIIGSLHHHNRRNCYHYWTITITITTVIIYHHYYIPGWTITIIAITITIIHHQNRSNSVHSCIMHMFKLQNFLLCTYISHLSTTTRQYLSWQLILMPIHPSIHSVVT